MRLLTVAQRIYVRIAAGQQNTVQPIDDRIDVLGAWNQADVHRCSTGRFDSLTVMSRQVKTLGRIVNAHRDPDAWSPLHERMITQVICHLSLAVFHLSFPGSRHGSKADNDKWKMVNDKRQMYGA